MNAEQLLAHYDRIADAPDAVARLRSLILSLAVRGKLVPQRQNDETAGALLKRVLAEKEKLEKDSKRPAGKVPKIVASGASPYEIPPGWKWVAVGAIVDAHVGGGTPSKSNSRYWNGDILWASVKDIGKNKFVESTIDTITKEGLANSSSNLIQPGHLIVVTRMGLGKISINRVPLAINQDLRALRVSKLVSIDYCYLFFRTHQFAGAGLTVKGIKVDDLLATPLPLPPMAEQRRIVAKVDELMALCDQLEAARSKREATRDRLAAASHARLIATDPKTFAADARFALNALSSLTARADQIKQIRGAIFNLAVQGRLLAQELFGESVHAAAIRPVSGTAVPFDVPTTWKWTRLGALVSHSDAGWSPRTENHPRSGDNWGVLKVSAVSWGRFLAEENKQVLPNTEPREQAIIRKGDFLLSRANTAELVARAVIVDDAPVNLMLSDKIVRLKLLPECDPRYLLLVNNQADFARKYYATWASGVSPSMKNVSRDVIYELPIPLPPLAEQKRIVAEVDELMALCDQLEASLATADDTRRRLLDALMSEALRPAIQAAA